MFESFMQNVDPYGSWLDFFMNGVTIVVNIIRVVGTGIAVIFLIWLAFKYITAEPEKKRCNNE